MDPTAVLRDLLDALLFLEQHPYDPHDQEYRTTALDGLDSLAGWLDRGGFPPKASSVYVLREGP